MCAAGLIRCLVTLLRPGGLRALVAENLLLRQQLLMLRRSRRRAPNLSPAQRLLAGACSILLYPRRLARAAVIFRPSTLLGIHRALVRRKYRNLFRSQRCHQKPGPPGPSPELVHVIVEAKERNPRFGCPRIASQVARVFGIEVDKDLVRRVLAKHYRMRSSTTTIEIAHTLAFTAERRPRLPELPPQFLRTFAVTAGNPAAEASFNSRPRRDCQFAMHSFAFG